MNVTELSHYLFAYDSSQPKELFMICTLPPFVVGRVVYLVRGDECAQLKFRNVYFYKVLKYRIAIAHEKNLLPCDNPDEYIYTIHNMAHLFYHKRIKLSPEKYKQWEEPGSLIIKS